MQGLNIVIVEDYIERIKKFRRKLIGNNVVITKNPKEAIDLLRTEPIDVLFLDHDLGGTGQPEPSGPGTGYEVAKWLEENPEFQPNQIIIHSLNPVGQKNMKAALPTARVIPAVWDQL